MRKSVVAVAVLLASVSTLAFAQSAGTLPPAAQAGEQPSIPASVENYAPSPVVTQSATSEVLTEPQIAPSAAAPASVEPAYQYTPYKIDSLYRKLPYAVIVQAASSEVRKDERGLLWTYTNFKVLQAVKGTFENNAFALRVVGGYREEPLLKETLATGGLDLRFTPGDYYFMFIDGVNDAGYPIVARQNVYVITGAPAAPVISDFKGGTMKIKRPDGKLYQPYEPVAVSDFVAALAKVK